MGNEDEVRALLSSESLMRPHQRQRFLAAMTTAISSGQAGILKLLLDKVTGFDYFGDIVSSLMTCAVEHGDVEVLRVLLAAKRDSLLHDVLWIPLMRAMEMERAQCVELLMEAKAPLKVENNRALHISASLGCHQTMQMLLDAKGDVNVLDDLGNNPSSCKIDDFTTTNPLSTQPPSGVGFPE